MGCPRLRRFVLLWLVINAVEGMHGLTMEGRSIIVQSMER